MVSLVGKCNKLAEHCSNRKRRKGEGRASARPRIRTRSKLVDRIEVKALARQTPVGGSQVQACKGGGGGVQ